MLISAIRLSFFLLIFAAFAIPSDGDHGILSIKSLAFLVCVGSTACYLIIQERFSLKQLQILTFFLGALTFFLIWLFLGADDVASMPIAQIDQFKLFIITLILPVITIYLVREKILEPQEIFKVSMYASFAYAACKLLLISMHLLHLFDLWEKIEILGIRTMRMTIYGDLERVQTSVDIVPPFLVFFVFQSKNIGITIGKTFRILYVVVTLLSTFFSFSRYLMAVYFCSYLLYWLSLKPSAMLIKFFQMMILFAVCLSLVGMERAGKVFEKRVLSSHVTRSDMIRKKQIDAMMDKFENHPIVGGGIGTFTPNNIREPHVFHLYEVQWVSFLMQFGVLGLFLLICPMILIAYRLVAAPFSRIRWCSLGVFLMWLFSGLTNPFLISLASGLLYSIFFVAAEILGNKTFKHRKEMEQQRPLSLR